jgi:hypothetical protein
MWRFICSMVVIVLFRSSKDEIKAYRYALLVYAITQAITYSTNIYNALGGSFNRQQTYYYYGMLRHRQVLPVFSIACLLS